MTNALIAHEPPRPATTARVDAVPPIGTRFSLGSRITVEQRSFLD